MLDNLCRTVSLEILPKLSWPLLYSICDFVHKCFSVLAEEREREGRREREGGRERERGEGGRGREGGRERKHKKRALCSTTKQSLIFHMLTCAI